MPYHDVGVAVESLRLWHPGPQSSIGALIPRYAGHVGTSHLVTKEPLSGLQSTFQDTENTICLTDATIDC